MRILIRSLLLAASTLTLATTAQAGERLFKCDDLANKARISSFGVPVYEGDDGWFFRAGDLNHFYMLSPETKRFLARLRDALASKGTTLVLLPIPPKSILEASYALSATKDGEVLFDPTYAEDEFRDMIAELQQSGVAAVDVLSYLADHQIDIEGDYFFARDIHWRPKLAKASALATGDLVKQLLGDAIAGVKTYKTSLTPAQPFASNTNSALSQICAQSLPAEDIDVYETIEADASVDSFLGGDDEPTRIDVIGTSFTAEVNRFNYSGFLREALGSEVATFSESGGGIDTSLLKYTNGGIDPVEGGKVLIWELPYPERLEGMNTSLERQVIPAVAGLCNGSTAQIAAIDYEAEARGIAKLDIPNGPSGSGLYVAASLSDASPRNFSFVFDYADGTQDIFPIIRPERLDNALNVFADLSHDLAAPIAQITMHNDNDVPVRGTLMLCRYPGDSGAKAVQAAFTPSK